MSLGLKNSNISFQARLIIPDAPKEFRTGLRNLQNDFAKRTKAVPGDFHLFLINHGGWSRFIDYVDPNMQSDVYNFALTKEGASSKIRFPFKLPVNINTSSKSKFFTNIKQRLLLEKLVFRFKEVLKRKKMFGLE